MDHLGAGILAGLTATLAVSGLLLGQSAMAITPQLDVPSMLGGLMETGPSGGWLAHLAIGSIAWGGLYGHLEERMSTGRPWLTGTLFASGIWLSVMLFVMPLAGHGLLGLRLGVDAVVVTFAMHVAYGLILGRTYAALSRLAVHPHFALRS